MPQLTIFEKIEVIFGNIMSLPVFLLLLLIPIIYIKKRGKILYILSFIILLLINYKYVLILFDNLVEFIISLIILPNMSLVLISLILALIILILKPKIINGICFALMQTMFGISLYLINKNDLDLKDNDSLYSSIDVITLMQMIMTVFALELFLIFFNKCVNIIMNKLFKNKKYVLNRKILLRRKKYILNKKILKTRKPKAFIPMPKEDILISSLEEESIFLNDINYYEKDNSFEEYKPNEEIKAIVKKALIPLKVRKYNLIKKSLKTKKYNLIKKSLKIRKYNLIKKSLKIRKYNLIKKSFKTKKYNLIKKSLKTKKYNLIRKSLKTKKYYLNKIKVRKQKYALKKNKLEIIKDEKLNISKISNEINKMNSNKYITKETKRKMEEELLDYKEKLIQYKKELLKKQMDEFTNMFNITNDDLK